MERDCFVGTNAVQVEVEKAICSYKYLIFHVMCVDKCKTSEHGMDCTLME